MSVIVCTYTREFNQLPKTARHIERFIYRWRRRANRKRWAGDRVRKPICEQLLLISDGKTAERPSYVACTALCRRFRTVTCNRNNRVYHSAAILKNPSGSGTMTYTRTKSNSRYCYCYCQSSPVHGHVANEQIYNDRRMTDNRVKRIIV